MTPCGGVPYPSSWPIQAKPRRRFRSRFGSLTGEPKTRLGTDPEPLACAQDRAAWRAEAWLLGVGSAATVFYHTTKEEARISPGLFYLCP